MPACDWVCALARRHCFYHALMLIAQSACLPHTHRDTHLHTNSAIIWYAGVLRIRPVDSSQAKCFACNYCKCQPQQKQNKKPKTKTKRAFVHSQISSAVMHAFCGQVGWNNYLKVHSSSTNSFFVSNKYFMLFWAGELDRFLDVDYWEIIKSER